MDRDFELLRELGGPEGRVALSALYQRHHAAVLRVTEALLRHGADAEDAAQDTFLRASRAARTYRQEGPVRSWLQRIAARVALDRRRHRVREEALEPSRFELSDTFDPALAAEAKEWQLLLLQALLDLPERLRRPLVLRYWDGRSLAEIAERLGIPRSTAHQRCRDGLDRLRERLAREGFEGLPAFLRGCPGAAALLERAALPTWLGSGALVMSTKGAIAGLAGVLLVVGLSWILSSGEGDGIAPTGPAQDGAGSDVAARASAASTGIASEDPAIAGGGLATREYRESEPMGRAGVWAIRGRVRASDGTVPPGTVVRAQIQPGWWEAWGVAPEPMAEVTLPMGEQGAFVWELKPPGGTVTVTLSATAQGFAATDVRRLVLRSEPPPQDLQLRLRALDVTLTGTVRDRAGAALPHPRVRCGREEAIGDAGGRYRIRASSEGTRVLWVTAWAEGFAKRRSRVATPEPGGRATVDFELDRGITIAGRVLDSLGRTLGGACVTTSSGEPGEQVTGDDGRYRLEGMPRSDESSLRVEAPGFAGERFWLEGLVADHLEKDLVLQPGSSLRGVVVDQQGAPLEGVRVAVGGFHFEGAGKAITGARGRFEIGAVHPGEVEIHAFREGFVQVAMTVVAPEPESPGPDLHLVLRRGRDLVGRIVDGAGLPVPEANVLVQRDDVHLMTRARTAADGRFVLRGLEGSSVRLEIYGRNLERVRMTVAMDDDPVEIQVRRMAMLAGRVVDAESGEPLRRFRIRLVSPELREGERAASGYDASLTDDGTWFAGSDGSWRIEGQVSCDQVVGVEASAPGHAPAWARRVITTARPDPEALVLRLPRAAVLSGTVRAANDGRMLAGSRVRWRAAGEEPKPWLYDHEPDARTRVADENGCFEIDDVALGEIWLDVSAPGHPRISEGPITIPGPATRTLHTVLLPAPVTLEGTLIDEAGEPVAGAIVRLTGASDAVRRQWFDQRTGADGRFAFPDLAPGRWKVAHLELSSGQLKELAVLEVVLPPRGVDPVRLAPDSR